MKKRTQANLALAVSAVGLVGSTTFGGTGFLAGLVQHGFIAATIGGLADWFAVTALFHRPLGIGYRTDILRRNRARLTEAIVDYTGTDLLSVRNIMAVVRAQDAAGLLVRYIEHRGGRERLHAAAETVARRTLAGLDTRAVSRALAEALASELRHYPVEELLAALPGALASEACVSRLLAALLRQGSALLDAPGLQEILRTEIGAVLEEYRGDSAMRAGALSMVGLTEDKVLSSVLDALRLRLTALESADDEAGQALRAYLAAALTTLGGDARFRALLSEHREALLAGAPLASVIETWLVDFARGERWVSAFHDFLETRIEAFCASPAWQRHADRLIKDLLESGLRHYHGEIPALIRSRLGEFTDDELVAFVEPKVEDDLQMIRINGAAVGSLVGMGLFVLVSLVEGVWGL